MSLNVQEGLLKIDGDTGGAVKALDEMKKKGEETAKSSTSWTESAAGMAGRIAGVAAGIGAVGLAIGAARAVWDDFNEAQRISADLFSQFGKNYEMAIAQQAVAIQNAADGMIKIQTAARAFNVLVRSDVRATTAEVQSLSKAAVNIARQTGEDANKVMGDMSRAVMTGETNELKKYGIVIDQTNAAVDAHIAALEKYGQTAGENEIKMEKSRNVLRQIHGEYKDQIVTVGDINEIESKYQNERARNMAISAKHTEETAKKIQELKHGWQDMKDSVTGYFNGIEHGAKKVMAALGTDAKRQIQDFEVDLYYKLEDVFGKSLDVSNKSLETFARRAEVESRLLASNVEHRLKQWNTLTSGELREMEQANTRQLRVYNELIKNAHLMAQLEADRSGPMSEETLHYQNLVTELEKAAHVIEGNNAKIADAKVHEVARQGMTRVSQVIEETGKYLETNTLKLKDYQGMSVDNLEKAGREHQRHLERVQGQLKHYENIQKLSKGQLGPAEQARLNVLKQQETVIKGQLGFVTDIFETLTGRKIKTAPDKKGAAPAWMQELQNIEALLRRKDPEINAAIMAKYGTIDKTEVKKKLINDNNEIVKLEKSLRDELAKVDKEASEARMNQLAEEEEGRKMEMERAKAEAAAYFNARREMAGNLGKVEEDYAQKIADLSSKRTLTQEERLEREKAALQKQINAITASKSELNRIRQEMAQSDVVELEQYKALRGQYDEAQRREYELRVQMKDKTVALEKEKNKELRAEMEKFSNDVKSYGQNLITNGAGALWDAMVIEKAALKESAMSRSEMVAKALKEELASIAKQAAVQAVYQGAMSLASFAIGDAKGGTGHAAAAAAYASVAGIAYAGSRAISAPSDAEIQRRKEAMNAGESSSLANSRAGVAGAAGAQQKVYNIYFPSGVILGDQDTVIRSLQRAEDEAERRGQTWA